MIYRIKCRRPERVLVLTAAVPEFGASIIGAEEVAAAIVLASTMW
jgi:hypothetical protein